MRTISVLAAALVAVSSVVASEDGPRPKYYFPRHVKRQFTNATITSEESVPPSSLSETTRRQTESDNESSGDPNVTTVIISSTIYVTPPVPTPTPDSSSSSESSSDSTSSSESSSESSSAAQSPSDSSSSSESTSVSSTEATSSSSSSVGEASSTETSVAETSTSEALQTSSSEAAPTSSSSSAAGETTSSPVAEPTTTTPVAEPTTTTPVVDPTTTVPEPAATSTSVVQSTSEEPPVPTTSTSEIILAPTGIVTSSSTSEPSNPLTSILSDINSVISSILEPPSSAVETTIPSSAITGPGTGISTETPTVTEPPATATETSTPPVTSSDPGQPPISNSTIPATETSTGTVTPEPPVTTSTSIPDPGTNTTTSFTEPPVITSSIISGNNSIPTGNSTVAPETTLPPTPTESSSSSRPSESGVTNITPLSTFTTSEPWLPSTILVAPSSSSATGKTPTTASGIPTTFPSAIAPNNGVTSTPDDTMLIQIGFREGYNYHFVVDNDRAAAQIFKLLPQALSDAGGFDISKAQVKRLVPLDTQNTLGYITTCAVVSYPINMVETLSIDIKLPNSALYNNRDQLIYNLTQQINPAIPIVNGAYPDGLGGTGGGAPGVNTPGGSANSDPFGTSGDNNNNSGGQSGAQRGTTAGIVSGAVAVAAAYGVVMFVLARRYKRKKQSHRRASSISSPSEMSEAGRGSPALMGGALLSRDFTSSYGAVQPGERNSHGSGRSGMGNSGRTQFISAPVAAENSLGWN